jgi:hypothetical protein
MAMGSSIAEMDGSGLSQCVSELVRRDGQTGLAWPKMMKV